MEYIECIKPGLLTTVQDLGRHSYQSYGISASGAMDTLSLRLGNIIVGNPDYYAGLEITLIGPTLIFHGRMIISITGTNLGPMINKAPIEMWKAVEVNDGDILSFNGSIDGSRSYLTIHGGIEAEVVMGSRSTFLRGAYGGIDGRPLKSGDCIFLGKSKANVKRLKGRKLPYYSIPEFRKRNTVRFIWGPQDHRFKDLSKHDFVQSDYHITNLSDRMGYRLKGKELVHIDNADIISDYIAPGAIQVPSNGQPIVLMADCQMTGGYTKIGMVVGVDLPLLAQKKAGDTICFEPITIEKAQREWEKQEKWLNVLKRIG